MPWLPDEERWQALESRVRDVEDGPYLCPACDTPYNSRLAAVACCEDD